MEFPRVDTVLQGVETLSPPLDRSLYEVRIPAGATWGG